MKKEQEEQELILEGDEVYIDSNFFITSVIDLGEEGENARKIIEDIKNGIFSAYTSTLTMDEVLWIIQKEKDRDTAYETAYIMVKMPNLSFISVDEGIMREAIEIYKKDKLNPRDSIHFSCMKKRKLNLIISSDSDFDKVKEIKRFDFTKVKYFDQGKSFKRQQS